VPAASQAGEAGTGFLFAGLPMDGKITRVNMRDQMKKNRVKPAGTWNVFELRAEGPKITAWVNGGVVSELASSALPLKGHMGLEAEGYRVEFRNLKVKELK
jgi:hypothetical protein